MSILNIEPSKINNFREMLKFAATEYGDKIAYIGNDFQKTFKDLKKDVETLAGYIIESKIQNEEIALIGSATYEYYVAYMAISISGNTVVIISEDLQIDLTCSIFENSNIKYAYVDFQSIDYKKQLLINKHCESNLGKMEDLMELAANAKSILDLESIEVDGKKECIKIFTTETKSIMLNQETLLYNARYVNEEYQKKAQTSDYTFFLINHGHGIIEDLAMTMYGIPTFNRKTIKKFSKKVILGKAFVTSIVPLTIEKMKINIKNKLK